MVHNPFYLSFLNLVLPAADAKSSLLAEIEPKNFIVVNYPLQKLLFISIIYHNKKGMSLSSKSRHKAYEVVCSRCRYNEKKGSRIEYSYKE